MGAGTQAATCCVCGRPKECYPVGHAHICKEGLERCAELFADVKAEEDARG